MRVQEHAFPDAWVNLGDAHGVFGEGRTGALLGSGRPVYKPWVQDLMTLFRWCRRERLPIYVGELVEGYDPVSRKAGAYAMPGPLRDVAAEAMAAGRGRTTTLGTGPSQRSRMPWSIAGAASDSRTSTISTAGSGESARPLAAAGGGGLAWRLDRRGMIRGGRLARGVATVGVPRHTADWAVDRGLCLFVGQHTHRPEVYGRRGVQIATCGTWAPWSRREDRTVVLVEGAAARLVNVKDMG